MDEDIRQIKELHLLTGVEMDEVEKVCRGLFISLLLSYYENRELHIPYLGGFSVKYKGSRLNSLGKNETEVDIDFKAHPSMKKLIGQAEDEKLTGIYNQNDAFKYLMKEIKYGLKDHID